MDTEFVNAWLRRACGRVCDCAGKAAGRLRALVAAPPPLLRYAALLALVVLLGSATRAARERLTAHAPYEPRPASASLSEEVSTPLPTQAPPRWSRPAPGEIVGGFSPDALVWSETLGQWQTHPGIDIGGSPGEAVCACADGVVADAYVDRLWGNVIVVDHGDGFTSTYAALNTLELAAPGEAVKGGEVIGSIGRSADCEAAMGWHLHFCLEKDGAPVDFEALLAGAA